MTFWPLTNSDFPTDQTFHQFHDLYTELDIHRIISGFHGAFATGVASQQGTLTLPDTWFRPPFWDLLMLQLLRPNFSNLPCLYSTFHLEYPLVLSRFCSLWRNHFSQICHIFPNIAQLSSSVKLTHRLKSTLYSCCHPPTCKKGYIERSYPCDRGRDRSNTCGKKSTTSTICKCTYSVRNRIIRQELVLDVQIVCVK